MLRLGSDPPTPHPTVVGVKIGVNYPLPPQENIRVQTSYIGFYLLGKGSKCKRSVPLMYFDPSEFRASDNFKPARTTVTN